MKTSEAILEEKGLLLGGKHRDKKSWMVLGPC